MKNNPSPLMHLGIRVLCATFFLLGCNMKDEVSKVSSDLAALRNVVNFDIKTKSTRWEVFGTPEYTGGVPGPTDFVTLIAEIEPEDQKFFEIMPPTGEVWIAPEAARPWLSSTFRSMLEGNKNTTVNLSSKFP